MIPKNHQLAYASGAWSFGVLALLVLSGSLSYELFTGLSLLGLLITVELMGPYWIRPAWRSSLDVVIGAVLVIFSAILVRKVLSALGMGW